MNAIAFIFSCLGRLLLLYTNAIDICILLWHPKMLLNSFIRFFSFFLRFYLYKIVSSVNTTSFVSFQIWMIFISFSCLIVLARTSSTTLNGNGDSGCLCLVLDLKEKAFSLWPLSMILIVSFSWMPFIRLKKFPSINSF